MRSGGKETGREKRERSKRKRKGGEIGRVFRWRVCETRGGAGSDFLLISHMSNLDRGARDVPRNLCVVWYVVCFVWKEIICR